MYFLLRFICAVFKINLSLAVLSLHCFAQAFSNCNEQGLLLWYLGFSLWWLLLWQSTGSRHVFFRSCSRSAQ